METKHTPGPWTDTGHSSDKRTPRYIRGPLSNGIAPAVATIPNGTYNYAMRDANARLIAAAPELLESIKALLPFIGLAPMKGAVCDCECARNAAYAAIAKAEGKES